MKRIFFRIFLWSWVLTVPVTLVGGYLAFRSFDRFLIYGMRYGSPLHDDLSLGAIGQYEMNRMSQQIRAGISSYLRKESTGLKSVHLFVPESNLSKLESHMPQSGFDYVEARMLIDGKLTKAEIKYRGDSFWRWAWDKKSMRIKTSRQTLFKDAEGEGMRSVNLLAAIQIAWHQVPMTKHDLLRLFDQEIHSPVLTIKKNAY